MLPPPTPIPTLYLIDGAIGCKDCLEHALQNGSLHFARSLNDAVSSLIPADVMSQLSTSVEIAESQKMVFDNVAIGQEDLLVPAITLRVCANATSNSSCRVEPYVPVQPRQRRLSVVPMTFNVTRTFDVAEPPNSTITDAVLEAVQLVDAGATYKPDETVAEIGGRFKAVSKSGHSAEGLAHLVSFFDNTDKLENQIDRGLERAECANVTFASVAKAEMEMEPPVGTTTANVMVTSLVLLLLVCCCCCFVICLKIRKHKKQKPPPPNPEAFDEMEVNEVDNPEAQFEPPPPAEIPHSDSDLDDGESDSSGSESGGGDLPGLGLADDDDSEIVIEEMELQVTCGLYGQQSQSNALVLTNDSGSMS